MKGETRIKILEFLEAAYQALDDVIFIFSQPYGTSYSRMEYLLEKHYSQKGAQKINRQIKKHFNDLLYHLKKDGLVTQNQKGNKTVLKITQKGKDVLEKFRAKPKEFFPSSKYEAREEKIFKIVIFDIPERERGKRQWLRSALANLNFAMLQKSVWAGKAKLPQAFLEDLNRMNILHCVEIFAISKTGSLKQLVTDESKTQ